ncbi:hypothetical protein LCGC14_2892460, partial [marine sediment metagenome]
VGTRLLYLQVAGVNVAYQIMDPANGMLRGTGGSDFVSSIIEDVGDGWYRVSVTLLASTTGSTVIRSQLREDTGGIGDGNYGGDGTSGLYIWGMQLVVGPLPLGYSKTVATAFNEFELTVVDDAGFADGDFIGVILDNGTQHQTIIDGAPAANVITIDDGIAGPAAISKVVVKAVDFAGNSLIPVSIETWAAKDRIYIANGVDTPRWYDGATCEIIENLPATTFSCRLIRIFKDYILLFHTVEDGTAYPQRERWSDAGFDNIWNETVNFNDFYQNDDWITAAEQLGPYLIIYKDRSIIRQAFLGETDKTWNFVQVVDGEGAVSQGAVANLGNRHIFLGNKNIFEYRGEFDIDPIGDDVRDKIFSVDGDLNVGSIGSAFLTYIEELLEVW